MRDSSNNLTSNSDDNKLESRGNHDECTLSIPNFLNVAGLPFEFIFGSFCDKLDTHSDEQILYCHYQLPYC